MDAITGPPPSARRSSLIFSLVAALLAVAALPFALATYQIYQARESLVEQALRTHLIAARASADRIEAMRSALGTVAGSLAQNPQLYEQPNSDSAREVLAGILVGQAAVRAAAIFYRDENGQDALIQMARQADAADLDSAQLRGLSEQIELVSSTEGNLLGVSQPTPRPGLRVALLFSAHALEEMLTPRELGPSAHLVLLKTSVPHPALAQQALHLPKTLIDSMRQPQVASLAVRDDRADGIDVAAFSRISDSDWSVASLQPAADAEHAAAAMRRSALAAMLAVVLLVAGLSTLAWRRVVQPVQALLSWQRNMLMDGGGDGGDLANLKASFQQIQRHQRNREALSEVFLGRYKLLSTLGQGAMGSVFLAWDPRLKRHVAIKTIHLEALDASRQQALAGTLENEAVAVANLRHRNIVGVHDMVASGAFAFVVMEYVEGGNLRQVIQNSGSLSAAEVIVIARALLRALGAAHKAGLLHLDIKPGNVLVPPEGEIKLTDFGIATWRSELPDLAARGGPAGTPGYIAPEYVLGNAPSERSDIFSLGVLLWECLGGERPPNPGSGLAELRRAALRPLTLPQRLHQTEPALSAVVERLCAHDPQQRPASASDAMTLFDAFSDSSGASRLSERARALGGDAMIGPATRSRTSPDAGKHSRLAQGDDAATRPAPIVVPAHGNNVLLAPPGAVPASEQATLPPPMRVETQGGRATLAPWQDVTIGSTATPIATERPSARHRPSTEDGTHSEDAPTLRSAEDPTTQPLP